MNMSERWHVAQYANGELVAHNVYNGYEDARYTMYRRGLLSGTNVLTRASRCECQGRLS